MDKQIPMQFEHAICPICNIEHPHGKMMFGKKELPPELVEKMEKLMGEATHFANCQECQTNLDNGYWAIIGLDVRLSTDEIPFRTGDLMWIHKDIAPKLFGDETVILLLAQGYAYGDMAIISLLKALENGPEEQVESKYCNLCKQLRASNNGCDRYYHPSCAWHVKN